jgi:hypothetical protein
VTFRCSVAAELREEPLAGTASTVRAFLLLEHPGPWGVHALQDARLPDGLGDELSTRAAASGVRVLLVRRAGRSEPRHGIRVFAAFADPSDPWLEATELADIHEVHDLDVEALGAGRSPGLTPRADPMFAVCTHGRHDSCCAERGRPVAAALAAVHPLLTWEISHIGGDRFAGNMMVLPHGLYYGRLDASAALTTAHAHLDGRLELDYLRGRSGLAMSIQAAEVDLRRHLGEPRHDAVRFVSRRGSGHLTDPDGHETHAVFDVDGVLYAVDVRSRNSPTTHQLTCKALRENPYPQHEVLDIRKLA